MAPVFRPIRGRARELIALSSAFLVATILLGALFSAGAQAAPGDLDLTFSGDGKQRADFGFGSGQAAAIALQPDGKIVAVGTTYDNFALARYNPDGSLDATFSGDGREATDFGFGARDAARGVAVQGDGKIVVVGLAGVGATVANFALARYNPNGSLDASFSGDGKQTTDFGVSVGASAVAIQADGKIVAAGGGGAFGRDFVLARYNADGSLDPSFSGDGKQATDFGGTEAANGVAIQADRKIVAVGQAGGAFGLARYNPNGTLDPTFSGDGRQTTEFGNVDYFDGANGVALQDDGKIVAVGEVDHDGMALARYNPNGSLDPGFSGDGKQTTNFAGYDDRASAVAIQADGRIVAAGAVGAGPNDYDYALARYNPTGSLDPSFSGDGKQTTDFGGRSDLATGVALQADGKIVAVGPANDFDYALARYNPNGTLDASFSGDGRQTTAFGGRDLARGVAIQADGKIVTVGVAGGRGDFALARYNPDGSFDTTFSGDGRQTTHLGGYDEARGVAIQPNGKIVVGGGGGGFFELARYNPNGSLDTSFSGDGKQTTDFGGSDLASGVALQGDGKIIAVGSGGGGDDFALARYNPNGSLDTSFSGDGKQTTDFGALYDRASGVVIQADGKIVAVGGDQYDFALARYNPNGSLDASFSGDGKQTTDLGGSDRANGAAIQADGKIVAVGGGGGYGAPGFVLARYNPNGSLDPSFSGDGKQTTDFGGSEFATGLAIQADGKVVAVGGGGGGALDFALARYNPNGSLDPGFSGDGKQTTDFGGRSDIASGVALQANGRIVVVGRGLGTDLTSDFALARYLGG